MSESSAAVRSSNPRAIKAGAVGGAVALVGVVVLGFFLWMVPSAAARAAKAACAGLRSSPPNPAICPGGQPCAFPVAAPDFTAVDYRGQPVKLSQFRGKVVLLNFWASWCGVCKTEKPSIDAMASELGGKDFVVVSLASDHGWADVLMAVMNALTPRAVPETLTSDSPMQAVLDAYAKALPAGVPFDIYLDPPVGDGNIGAIASAWGVKAVPESFLIDRQGQVIGYFANKRDWSSRIAQTCIQSKIDE